MLLRFRVTNHKSIRDTTELVFTKSSFAGMRPKDGDWGSVTNRVAGIFGPNASGKTTLLDAVDFAVKVINNSAKWSERESFPYAPYLLDRDSRTETSAYEFDFTVKGTRHVYGFESNSGGISSEWLQSFPEGRRRILFERSGPEPEDVTFSRNLKGENARISRLMGRYNLYLSTASMANHSHLRRIHHYLTRHLRYAAFSESQKQSRILSVKKWIEDEEALQKAQNLLRFADLGICRLSLEEVEVDEQTQSLMRRTMKAFLDEEDDEEKLFANFLEEESKVISFWHQGSARESSHSLGLSDESSGTVAWLSLALPALQEIKYGGVLFVDELDSSLHPRLASALISMFKSPDINPNGAQLVFTSHDTSLMGHLSGDGLDKEEMWFSEKSPEGFTEIYPLTDFSVKKDHNVERRYLGGRYGAVPTLAWEELLASLRVETQS
ncbi:AAA family ATPase [Streptomyces sp. WMMC897]|uniref:AAA family ATPase n=1 Tax=Streptomyces sp. WMMC897 TaxID=3014782 RepID=UPI0022B75195|nr:ATP-binding protein [Streptomyces sp. WMMC897]MCZ7417053.1 ATP-binding protein [Streptomyces sp. WMMC897]